jgi:hypothetical protein
LEVGDEGAEGLARELESRFPSRAEVLCDDWTAEMVASPPKVRSNTAMSAVNRCFIFWVTYLLGT